jgi:hypothetical protein
MVGRLEGWKVDVVSSVRRKSMDASVQTGKRILRVEFR